MIVDDDAGAGADDHNGILGVVDGRVAEVDHVQDGIHFHVDAAIAIAIGYADPRNDHAVFYELWLQRHAGESDCLVNTLLWLMI